MKRDMERRGRGREEEWEGRGRCKEELVVEGRGDEDVRERESDRDM